MTPLRKLLLFPLLTLLLQLAAARPAAAQSEPTWWIQECTWEMGDARGAVSPIVGMSGDAFGAVLRDFPSQGAKGWRARITDGRSFKLEPENGYR